MRTYVDAVAGFATFRQRRSLCVRLHGTLDVRMARGIGSEIRRDEVAVRLRLECSALQAVETGGAAILASAILAWTQGRADRSVDILNLDLGLHSAAAWQPLRTISDGAAVLFFDPDIDAPWVGEPQPSGAG